MATKDIRTVEADSEGIARFPIVSEDPQGRRLDPLSVHVTHMDGQPYPNVAPAWLSYVPIGQLIQISLYRLTFNIAVDVVAARADDGPNRVYTVTARAIRQSDGKIITCTFLLRLGGNPVAGDGYATFDERIVYVVPDNTPIPLDGRTINMAQYIELTHTWHIRDIFYNHGDEYLYFVDSASDVWRMRTNGTQLQLVYQNFVANGNQRSLWAHPTSGKGYVWYRGAGANDLLCEFNLNGSTPHTGVIFQKAGQGSAAIVGSAKNDVLYVVAYNGPEAEIRELSFSGQHIKTLPTSRPGVARTIWDIDLDDDNDILVISNSSSNCGGLELFDIGSGQYTELEPVSVNVYGVSMNRITKDIIYGLKSTPFDQIFRRSKSDNYATRTLICDNFGPADTSKMASIE